MDKLFNYIPIRKLSFPTRLWFRFYWHKLIKREDVIGFFGKYPIIRDKNIEKDREN